MFLKYCSVPRCYNHIKGDDDMKSLTNYANQAGTYSLKERLLIFVESERSTPLQFSTELRGKKNITSFRYANTSCGVIDTS